MANISREEEQRIKELRQRTGGGGCKDRMPTVEERIATNDAEIAKNLRILRELAKRARPTRKAEKGDGR